MTFNQTRSFVASLCVTFSFAGLASAEVKPSALFSDHMVLQSGMLVPIWGTADPSEKVTITFNGQKKSATADANGKWTVRLAKLKAGGPFEMTIAGSKAGEAPIVVKDVLVGEVWLGSGQSNMQFYVSSKGPGMPPTVCWTRRRRLPPRTIRRCACSPSRRPPRRTSRKRTLVGHWQVCTSGDGARLLGGGLSVRARSESGAQTAGRYRAVGLWSEHCGGAGFLATRWRPIRC